MNSQEITDSIDFIDQYAVLTIAFTNDFNCLQKFPKTRLIAFPNDLVQRKYVVGKCGHKGLVLRSRRKTNRFTSSW